MGSVTTRDAALHQRLKVAHMRDRLRRRRQRRRARCCARCRRSRCATRRRTRAGAHAGGVVGRAGPRSRRCCIRRSPGSPGHEHWKRAVHATRPACSRSSSTRASRARRSTPSSMRSSCSGSATRGPGRSAWSFPYDLATMRAQPRLGRHAGALLDRPRGRRGPDRGLPPGAGRSAATEPQRCRRARAASATPAQAQRQRLRRHRERELFERLAAAGASRRPRSRSGRAAWRAPS